VSSAEIPVLLTLAGRIVAYLGDRNLFPQLLSAKPDFTQRKLDCTAD
jgi:hypothetical protein